MTHEIRPLSYRLHNDLTGKTFGQWTVLGFAGMARDLGIKGSNSFWVCRCECCGIKRIVKGSHLSSGDSASCGKTGGRTDGSTSHPLYKTMRDMKYRCYNKTSTPYKYYGGRGIKIDTRWLNDFWSFVKDMGPKPTAKHSIERIDNDGNYCKENCRWATSLEQNKNRSGGRYITANGETKRLTEWANRIGVGKSTIRTRIDNYGWCETCAVTIKPYEKRCQHKKPH